MECMIYLTSEVERDRVKGEGDNDEDNDDKVLNEDKKEGEGDLSKRSIGIGYKIQRRENINIESNIKQRIKENV